MIEIQIPGNNVLKIEHVVLDYNGTIALDGRLIDDVRRCLMHISKSVQVHVVTADTVGSARDGLNGIDCKLHLLTPKDQDRQKLEYVKLIGPHLTVCIGNGRNDKLMLKEASLGIGIISGEGAFTDTLLHANIICTSIVSALELLIYPHRLKATLRN
jgi:soluble P-type ATPase